MSDDKFEITFTDDELIRLINSGNTTLQLQIENERLRKALEDIKEMLSNQKLGKPVDKDIGWGVYEIAAKALDTTD